MVLKVGDIMTRNFVSVSPDSSLKLCMKEMIKGKVGSVIVREKGKLIGILTQGDIVRAIYTDNISLTNTKAKEICTKKVVTIKPEEEIDAALNKMKKGHKRLPVVSGGKLIGLITIKDILRISPDVFNDVTDMIKIKEESEKMKKFSATYSGEGVCEDCGNYKPLIKLHGQLVCEDCSDI